MKMRSVVVAGGGFAGLAAALMLARDGHAVTLVERDSFPVGNLLDSVTWPRKGVAHFLQPHAFMPRGRLELRTHFGDVYDTLLANGAFDIDLRRKIPGTVTPHDADLQYLAVRRPVIEWAMRKAVVDEPNITVRANETVNGLQIHHGQVAAVVTDRGEIPADLVVDALGRRTPSDMWLASAGSETSSVETSDCGVIYFSRYYQLREGFDLPDGPWMLGPRGDLGFMGYTTFPGDNRTFAALLAVPPGQPSARLFKESVAFDKAVSLIPSLTQWVDPEGVDPITDVMTMAGLRNTFREFSPEATAGFVAVGDASFHSDPVIALGLTFALIQAVELASAMREQSDLHDALLSFRSATTPLMRERFDFATALDEQRLRMWRGEGVDITSRQGDYALFSLVAGGAAAAADDEIFRVTVRRMGLLDSNSVLDSNVPMQIRIEELFKRALSAPRPSQGPNFEELMREVELSLAPHGS